MSHRKSVDLRAGVATPRRARAPARGAGHLAPALIAVAGLLGCAALPDVPAGTCGNAVIEAPEDCDTFAPDTSSLCRPKGSPGECHLDCRARSDGTRASCPSGWGCDSDGICRAATGDFDPAREYRVGGASSLMAGDFDGDGRADIVSREPLDALGRTKLRFHYFDEKGALAVSRSFPKLVASPLIRDLSGDGFADVVFSDFRVGVLLGQRDRSWVPETFGSYVVPGGPVRMVAVYDGSIGGNSAMLALATLSGRPGWYFPDAAGVLRLRGTVPGPIESLSGDPATGNLIEDPVTSPCREVVAAVRGASTFTVLEVCSTSPTGTIVWRDDAELQHIGLDPDAAIESRPLLADMNGDGHLDVVVGASGQAYVAYGDGRELAPARPYPIELALPEATTVNLAMPLAAGDITGDGVVDFVLGDRVLIGVVTPPDGVLRYSVAKVNVAAPWTEAVIADMNGNGKPDVIAASSGRLGIDFFNGTGSQHLTSFTIPTDRPVAHLAVGDFDGDLLHDLAFVEPADTLAERDALMMSFGTPAGPPLAPNVIARIAATEQVSVHHQLGMSNLVVSSRQVVDAEIRGVFTVLDGSGDRIPYGPHELVSFEPNDYLANSYALGLALGHFASARPEDVLAIATKNVVGRDWQVWLLPELHTAGSASVRLSFNLDPRLAPVHEEPGGRAVVNLASASADLDGDGRDEALWAMPIDTPAQCGVVIIGTAPDGDALRVRSTVVLDAPCLESQLLPVDADRDGHIDLALLTGTSGAESRRLLVLWNDGHGVLSATDVAVVNDGTDSPRAFAALGASDVRPFSFAYVTDTAALLVSPAASSTPRHFGPPRVLTSLRRGTGIVAADVNGDRALDLVVAAAGNLTVLKAELLTP